MKIKSFKTDMKKAGLIAIVIIGVLSTVLGAGSNGYPDCNDRKLQLLGEGFDSGTATVKGCFDGNPDSFLFDIGVMGQDDRISYSGEKLENWDRCDQRTEDSCNLAGGVGFKMVDENEGHFKLEVTGTKPNTKKSFIYMWAGSNIQPDGVAGGFTEKDMGWMCGRDWSQPMYPSGREVDYLALDQNDLTCLGENSDSPGTGYIPGFVVDYQHEKFSRDAADLEIPDSYMIDAGSEWIQNCKEEDYWSSSGSLSDNIATCFEKQYSSIDKNKFCRSFYKDLNGVKAPLKWSDNKEKCILDTTIVP